jgi:segregation and condensation protein B
MVTVSQTPAMFPETTEDDAPAVDVDAMPRGARGAIEAVLMVVEEPVPEIALAAALGIPQARVEILLEEIATEYERDGRGFELRQVAGGWRIYSRAEYAPVVERFLLEGQTAKLTQAALETLAIVAYKQPVTRHQISAIRGVNSDGVLRAMVDRGLIEEAGRDEGPGRAVLYATTPAFLERLGLPSLAALPSLAPLLEAGVEEPIESAGSEPVEGASRPPIIVPKTDGADEA